MALPKTETNSMENKRVKIFTEKNDYNSLEFIRSLSMRRMQKRRRTSYDVLDYSDPFSIRHMLNNLGDEKYGSVSKDMQVLFEQKMRILGPYLASGQEFLYNYDSATPKQRILNDSSVVRISTNASVTSPVLIIDSDDESCDTRHPVLYQEVSLALPAAEGKIHMEFDDIKFQKEDIAAEKTNINKEEGVPNVETNKNEGEFIGVEECLETKGCFSQNDTGKDGLDDIWKEMTFALECSKDVCGDLPTKDTGVEDCDHSFILKDDIGYVCRICGVIDRRIESIIDFQYGKNARSRTYRSEAQNARDEQGVQNIASENCGKNGYDLSVTEICAHPMHSKQMKPHQVEGFNFLVSNLVSERPGGCILAHAPGSGKTFMIISFMQCFMAKYPSARPLVVLPKGILSTWKREFQRWAVEDIPLYDFYSSKADNRNQQLEVLQTWQKEKSILFLGYKQFATIVCNNETGSVSEKCEDLLLGVPSILILDEGHTPRNENTDVLQSLAKVRTPRKVVLSGTLYQNHVKEVFNVLNLVRPRFLKSITSREIVKRIMCRVQISGVRKQMKSGADLAFYDAVEHTLQKEEDYNRKITVIQDLRQMTSNVLHYYKGDFLDELPGIVDYTLILNLSSPQRREVRNLKKFERKFKVNSVGSAVYLHPMLAHFAESSSATDETMDEMLMKLDIRDGVKAKFFMNLLGLCESANEKLLVFSQYLLPLKFMERLSMSRKGWVLRKQIFVISGDSSSEEREQAMEQFNTSRDAKVFFGSIKACGEGISLVGASRVLILDVHLNPSVTRQAIGRAFRPGQMNKVYVYRLVAGDSPEEVDHNTCFKKELISKMWFEWEESCNHNEFKMEEIDLCDSGDQFLETRFLSEDVNKIFRR